MENIEVENYKKAVKDDIEYVASKVKDADFTEVIKELGYEGKTLEETVALLEESKNGFDIIEAFGDKYHDDILDLGDENEKIYQEGKEKLDELSQEEAATNNSRLEHVRKYNELNHDLSGVKDNKVNSDSLKYELNSVLEELVSIDRKEKLLNGNLSNRAIRRREELLKKKEELENTQEVKKNAKKTIYKMYQEDINKLEKIKNERNKIIEEVDKKRFENYSKIDGIREEIDKYKFIQYEMLKKMASRRQEIDKEFNDVEQRFNDAIKSGETSYIATLGTEYIEKKNKKIEYDNKIKALADTYSAAMEEMGIILDAFIEDEKSIEVDNKVETKTEELTENPEVITITESQPQSALEEPKVETKTEELVENPEVEPVQESKKVEVENSIFNNYGRPMGIDSNPTISIPSSQPTTVVEDNKVEEPKVETKTEELIENPEVEPVMEPELVIESAKEEETEQPKVEKVEPKKEEKPKKTPWYQRFIDSNDEEEDEDEDVLDIENQKSIVEEVKERMAERRKIKSVEKADESLVKKAFEKLKDKIARFALNDEGYEVWQEEQKAKTK